MQAGDASGFDLRRISQLRGVRRSYEDTSGSAYHKVVFSYYTGRDDHEEIGAEILDQRRPRVADPQGGVEKMQVVYRHGITSSPGVLKGQCPSLR